MAPTSSDPTKSMERIYQRIHETERLVKYAEQDGYTALAASYRRRLAGLRSAYTRFSRQVQPRTLVEVFADEEGER